MHSQIDIIYDDPCILFCLYITLCISSILLFIPPNYEGQLDEEADEENEDEVEDEEEEEEEEGGGRDEPSRRDEG